MNPDIHIIYKKLFGKNSPDEIDMDDLIHMSEQYPYYPVLQYLLAERKKSISDPSFDVQMAKTAVFFSNPHWLAWLMERRKTTNSLDVEFVPTEVQEEDREEFLSESQVDTSVSQSGFNEAVVEEMKEEGELQETPEPVIMDDHIEQQTGDLELNEVKPEGFEKAALEIEIHPENPIVEPEHNGHDEVFNQTLEKENVEPGINMVEIAEYYTNNHIDEEKIEDRVEEQQNIDIETKGDEEIILPVDEVENTELEQGILSEAETTPDEIHEKAGSNEADEILSSIRGELQALNSENGQEQVEEIHQTSEEIIVETTDEKITQNVEEKQELNELEHQGPEKRHLIDIEVPFISIPAPPVPSENPKVESPEEEFETDPRFEEELNEPLPGIKLPDFNKNVIPVAASNEPLVPIEPLYTIDYFASQGIKLSAEEESKDKLGQKLKSFTEWLKTMKKIHPDRLEKKMDDVTNEKIQNIAEHSNASGEVFTEAMAEVFAKQGLKYKAIEVYRKLSLLNPDKSHYFAAKIQDLNG